jgi:hypothetical protein
LNGRTMRDCSPGFGSVPMRRGPQRELGFSELAEGRTGISRRSTQEWLVSYETQIAMELASNVGRRTVAPAQRSKAARYAGSGRRGDRALGPSARCQRTDRARDVSAAQPMRRRRQGEGQRPACQAGGAPWLMSMTTSARLSRERLARASPPQNPMVQLARSRHSRVPRHRPIKSAALHGSGLAASPWASSA